MSRVIAIDGPAGAGKSSASRGLAQRLGFAYVDTGAMYRVVGVLAHEQGIAFDDDTALAALCAGIRFEVQGERLAANGRDLSEVIRRRDAGDLASRVSTRPVVRERLVALQRALGAQGGVVMEGRDIGTVVFPDAPLKFFLTAVPDGAGRATRHRAGGARRDRRRRRAGARARGARPPGPRAHHGAAQTRRRRDRIGHQHARPRSSDRGNGTGRASPPFGLISVSPLSS